MDIFVYSIPFNKNENLQKNFNKKEDFNYF